MITNSYNPCVPCGSLPYPTLFKFAVPQCVLQIDHLISVKSPTAPLSKLELWTLDGPPHQVSPEGSKSKSLATRGNLGRLSWEPLSGLPEGTPNPQGPLVPKEVLNDPFLPRKILMKYLDPLGYIGGMKTSILLPWMVAKSEPAPRNEAIRLWWRTAFDTRLTRRSSGFRGRWCRTSDKCPKRSPIALRGSNRAAGPRKRRSKQLSQGSGEARR